jgi:hypothetical protein
VEGAGAVRVQEVLRSALAEEDGDEP